MRSSEVSPRAVMIPGLESAPESDFGSFWTSDYEDSGSGSFSLESLESAPVLESAPLVGIEHCWSLLQQAELSVISYFNAQNRSYFKI